MGIGALPQQGFRHHRRLAERRGLDAPLRERSPPIAKLYGHFDRFAASESATGPPVQMEGGASFPRMTASDAVPSWAPSVPASS